MSLPNEQQNMLKENPFGEPSWISEENYTFALLSIVTIPWNHVVSSWSTPMVPWFSSSTGTSSGSSVFIRSAFSRSSPKFIATQSIFLLLFHLTQSPASFMSTLLLLIFSIDGSWNTSALIPMCFPIISPFTVMGHDSIICRAYSSSVRNIKSSHLFRSM